MGANDEALRALYLFMHSDAPGTHAPAFFSRRRSSRSW